MTDLQILSRVLNNQDISLIRENNLDATYFVEYEDEFKYIQQHYNEYGQTPDKVTFLSKFPDFEIIVVEESDKYLIDTIREEHAYTVAAPVINRIAELMQEDTYAAFEYLQSQLPTLFATTSQSIGVDIIAQAQERYEEYKAMAENPEEYFIQTGFEQLDELLGGWHKGEELVVLFARTGMGKSWVLIKMLEHAWKMGSRVALLEPEMSASKTGFRFDTIFNHFSNKALTRGKKVDAYDNYIDKLQESNVPFIVAHPKDFNRKVSISKLKTWIVDNKFDIVAIDGISYLMDERKERGDSITTQLTHISEDLMELSIELGIPIIVIAQSNRGGTITEEPELDNIRDSDGIAYNASVVISVAQIKDTDLVTLAVKKSRNGENNVKYRYHWNIDTGEFVYEENYEKQVDDTAEARPIRRKSEDRGRW